MVHDELKLKTMIYKLTFEDGRIDWCTAKSVLHLLKSYDKEYDMVLHEVEDIEEISEEEAQDILVANTECDESMDEPETFTIWELAVGDEFEIIASSEFL